MTTETESTKTDLPDAEIVEEVAPSPLYTMFETDTELEKEGLVLDYGTCKITIARAGGANRKYASVLEHKMRPHRAALNSGTMDETLALRLLVEAYAEAIVLGWEKVTDRAGKALPYSKKNVVQLFTDLPELFADVRGQADRVANFTMAGAQADAKS